VEQLSADITRFLESRPVHARKRSRAYQVRRMLARHRAAFAMSGVFLLLLSTAVVGALWQARIASRERERALRRFNDVRELASALIFRIHDEVSPLAGSTPVRQTVIAEGLRFLERLEADAGDDPALQLELSRAYVRIGNVQGNVALSNMGNREQAIRSYRRARELATGLVRSRTPEWDAVAALVEANIRLSQTVEGTEAVAAADAALASASEWQPQEPGSTRTRVLLARAHFNVAVRRPHGQRLPHWLEANRLFAGVLAEDPGDMGKMRNVALTEKYLASHFHLDRDFDRALQHYQRAYALDARRLEANPDDRQALIDFAIDIGGIASAFAVRNRYEEAISAYKESLEIRERIAATDPKDLYARGRVSFVHTQLAGLFLVVGQVAAAGQHARRALALTENSLDYDDDVRAQHAIALQRLGEVHWRSGQQADACRLYRRAMSHFRLLPGDFATGDRRLSQAAAERSLQRCSRQ
jgi:eukaryotic-like serine/threonine-protein kinase